MSKTELAKAHAGSLDRPDAPATASILMLGEAIHPLRPVPGRRMPQWRVTGAFPKVHDDGGAADSLPLNYILLRHNQTPMAQRVPVLATGPDTVPEGLLRTLATHEAPLALPIVRVTYVPPGPPGFPDPTGGLFVLWPDRTQLAALDDEQELHRVLLSCAQFRIVMPSGENLSHCYRYGEQSTTTADGVSIPVCYEDEPPVHPIADGALRTLRSSDDFDRCGQPTVRVPPEFAARLGRRQVLVSFAASGTATKESKVQALARPIPHSGLRGERAVEVDQLIRNAIGAEIGEDVVLTPVKVRRNRAFDFIAGRPSYVVCRVQTADLPTVEQEVCLLDELTLGILGVQPGDEVIIEGVAEPGGVVKQVRAKAFKTSEVVQQRRESLHGGDLSCRFPSSRDALAVYPDLPWVFLDSATRSALHLAGQKLATVRLRPSRRYQLRKEMREMLLLLGLAFIGLVSILHSVQAQLISLGGLILLVAAGVLTRIRGRLKHDLRVSLGQRIANRRERRRPRR
ncbi:hypothetical protein [Amycolatopsis sp. 195334CR]|uniref:hypothetical protein n=1 Tax=Amycolatopsis sp. 195334CR TaxID=2814588 RepID=UPI001A90A456|nr:hypothetical protein [Amycolatopsis sp. 195334CR]MBN6034071.1 hypothetical protein [Amycolatopsis sp. 195334CR]